MQSDNSDELERSLAEQGAALQNLRCRYRQLVDTVDEAVCLLDPGGTLQHLNAAAERLFESPADALLGRQLSELVEADGWRRLQGAMGAAGGGEVVTLRLRLQRENGLCWCDCTLLAGASPWADEARLVLLCRALDGGSGTGADLVESHEIYRQMFQRSPALKLLVDPRDGRIVDSNKATAAFYGYSVAQLKQLHLWSLSTAETTQEVVAMMRRAIANEQNSFAARQRTASGGLREVELYTCPVRVGGREYLHAIIHDTTERQRFARALEAQRRFMEEAIDTLPGPFFLLNAAGRFVLWNDYFEQRLGYSSEEMAAATPPSFLPSAARERAMAVFEDAFTGGILDLETTVLARDGERRAFYLCGRRLDHGESLLVGMGIDVTERREAERQRLRLLTMLDFGTRLGRYSDSGY